MGAIYMGWDFDEAMTRLDYLEDGKQYLEKAIRSLKEAKFPYAALEGIVEDVKEEMTNIITATCRQMEERANNRLSGDL